MLSLHLIICACTCAHIYTQRCARAYIQNTEWCTLRSDDNLSESALYFHHVLLGTKPRSSGLATNTFNHWASWKRFQMPSPLRNDMPEHSGVPQSEHHTICTTGTEMSHAINVNKYLSLKIKKFSTKWLLFCKVWTHIYTNKWNKRRKLLSKVTLARRSGRYL